MNVAPSTAFEAVCDFGVTGLTPGVRILDNAGATTTARVTASRPAPTSPSGDLPMCREILLAVGVG